MTQPAVVVLIADNPADVLLGKALEAADVAHSSLPGWLECRLRTRASGIRECRGRYGHTNAESLWGGAGRRRREADSLKAMNRPEVLELLRENLERAQEFREAASREFDEAMKAMPRGGGSPENVKRLREASKRYSAALEELSKALKHKTDFLLYGTVPDHGAMPDGKGSPQKDGDPPAAAQQEVGEQ